MCHNHSHITVATTGTVVIGPNTLVEVKMEQPLEVQWRSGDKWIRPSGLHLYLPYSMRARLPLSAPLPMGVCLLPTSYTTENAISTLPETAMRLWSVGGYGMTASLDSGVSPMQGGEDDEVPF